MKKLQHSNGFLGFRTPKEVEATIKALCETNNREVSEVLNYLCRIFIEDAYEIKSKFLNGHNKTT